MTLAEFLAALAAAEPMILDAIKAEEPVVASSVQAAYDTIKAFISAKALDATTVQEDVNAAADLYETEKFGPAK